ISYSFVREVFNDGSAIEYYYSTYRDTPDDTSSNGLNITLITLNTAGNKTIVHPQYSYNLYRQPISYHFRRGKLLSKHHYNNNHTLLLKNSYKYNHLQKQYAEHLTSFYTGYLYVSRTLISDYPLESERNIQYVNNDSVMSGKKYGYNSVGRLAEVLTMNSNGDSLKTELKYISDIHTNSSNNKLYQKNQLALPVYQNDYVKNNGSTTWTLFNSVYTTYGYPDSYLTSKVTQSKGWNPITGQLSNYVTDYTYNYDAQGRVISITDRAGIKTAYLWGYNGLYPIAELRNINGSTPSQSYLSLSNDQSIRNLHSTLRSNYPEGQVMVYTYKPAIGKTSETSPDGTTTYYEYDSFGRLQWAYIMDEQGNHQYLEGYKYQYTNP
ncbi:MAG: hypothetical protein LBL97_02165, partial [Prevotellaceae bacterium]|nr:hypothetical protein [Prevotellaceae bacterium]